ncbi:MAG: hypothetical protein JSV52_14545 [Candidatus Zixiibacteriota bacterium]|nr:MAG: hypothetical protein JSV52_14545 [candidate division Zixibacteria bacterium]
MPNTVQKAMRAFGLIWLSILMSANPAVGDIPSVFWGGLEPGQYAVGFETIEKFDYSRTFRDKYDYDGNLRERQTARPIQLCVWYPAKANPTDRPMVYGEYAFPAPEDPRFYDLLSGLQAREANYLVPLLGSLNLLADMMNLRVGATKKAERAEGSFPLIIYHPDVNRAYCENAALCEYLASHGYIVATSHTFGTADLPVMVNAANLETMVRDRELVYGSMYQYPHVDMSRPAVVGCGMGGLSALLMQMRNTDIEAVVVLDGTQAHKDGIDLAATFPSFNVIGADVPLLQIYISAHENLDLSLTDSLLYSLRYLAGMPGFVSNDFTQYTITSSIVPDSMVTPALGSLSNYRTICELTRDFLEVHLLLKKEGLSAGLMPAAERKFELTILENETAPPTEAQFMEMIQADRIDRAVEIYEAFKKSRPGYVFFQEATLNAAGYGLLQANQLEEARMIFKINTEAFPNSANVWDSYADACIASGDTETAIMCYQRVLEVLPADSLIDPAVQEILLNNATQGLQDLQK